MASKKYHPTLFYKVTLPDGKQIDKEIHVPAIMATSEAALIFTITRIIGSGQDKAMKIILCFFLIFTNDEYENIRLPIIFIQDNDRNIVFESHDKVKYQIEKRYKDSASDKIYPSSLSYIFEKNGTTVKYALKANKTIEAKGKNNLPFSMKIVMKLMHIQASYSRYTATGHMELNTGNATIVRDNSLIYEIMCPGTKCVELMKH